MQIPELKEGERNKAKDKHPSLPLPELVVSIDANKKKFDA